MGAAIDPGTESPQQAGYLNGRLPLDALTKIGIGGHRLWGAAATTWMQMMRDAAGGVSLFITDSYRTYDQQVDLAKRKGLTSQGGWAATPGTSNHGWGLAVDADTPTINWLKANGARYGWANTVAKEPWHWEYVGYRAGAAKATGAAKSTDNGGGSWGGGSVSDTVGAVAGAVVDATPGLGDAVGAVQGIWDGVTGWVGDFWRLAAKIGAIGLAAATGAALVVLGVYSGVRRQLPANLPVEALAL